MEETFKTALLEAFTNRETIDTEARRRLEYIENSASMNEKDAELTKVLETMKGKIDLLLGGENEANKLIDQIVPNIEKIRSDVKRIEKEVDKEGRLGKVYNEVSKIREDQKDDRKIYHDLLHNIKRSREEQNDRFKKIEMSLHDLKKTPRRDRSRSESSDRNKNRSSRSRSRGKRDKARATSRETSISSLNRIKTEQEIEKKISKVEEQVNEMSNVLVDLKKDSTQRSVVETQMLSTIGHVAELLKTNDNTPPIKISKFANDEDSDRSPSPLNRASRSV